MFIGRKNITKTQTKGITKGEMFDKKSDWMIG